MDTIRKNYDCGLTTDEIAKPLMHHLHNKDDMRKFKKALKEVCKYDTVTSQWYLIC